MVFPAGGERATRFHEHASRVKCSRWEIESRCDEVPDSMLSIPVGHAAGQGTTGIYSPLLPETGASSVPPAPLKLSSLAPPSFLWLACRHPSGSLRGAGNHAARDQPELDED